MPHRDTIVIAVLALLLIALSSEATAASTSRPIVYSKTTWEWVGFGEARTQFTKGGIFATKGGKAVQLTHTPWDSQPNVSPDGSTIAFIREGDLYAMEADGSGQRRLTAGPEIDERPVISPSGRYVLFTRRAKREAPGDLYTIAVSGGSARALTTWPGEDREAAFSLDGKTVMFVRSLPMAGGGTNDDLYSIRPTGLDMTRLTRTPQDELRPHYFAHGIVFDRRKTAAGGPATIFTMHRDGTRTATLVTRRRSANVVAVSPDGGLLLFNDRDLWAKQLVRSSGGSSQARLIRRGGGDNLVFSPNGRRIAGIFMAPGAFFHLSSIDLATGVSRGEGEVFEPEAPGPVQTSIGGIIAW
jgi:dipeptidyl aminopeptidase/acylaminoacyl peptidase